MMLKFAVRRWALLLGVLMTVLFMAPDFVLPCALAEDDGRNQLEISITAKPAEMVEPGDVMLNFSIENVSAVDAQNVYLSSADGLLSEPVGQLSAGASQSFNRQHTVSVQELDAGEITYIISHDDPFDPNSKVNYTVAAEIRRSDARPLAELTRRFSNSSVNPGDTLVITYRIRNTGNVVLTGLRVQDTLGDFTGQVDRLDVGESQTLISRVVIDDETISSAVLDYYAEDSEDIHTLKLADAELTLAQPGLETTFSAGLSAFSANVADAALTLINTGNVDIRNLRVTDDIYGGIIADSITVPAGESVEVSHSYALRGDMRFRWSVSAVNDAGGRIAFTTEEVSVASEAGEFAAPTLEVSAITPRIRRSGSVRVQVRIANPGSLDLQDVVLSEASMGELRRFAVIPAGGAAEREFSFYVSEDTGWNFSLEYTDFSGTLQRTADVPVEITIAADGVLPEGVSPGFIEFTGNSIKIGGSSTFAVLLIAGLSVLLVLIILLVIASRRARLEKQLRIAAEKQRRREDRSKRPAHAKNKSKGRT